MRIRGTDWYTAVGEGREVKSFHNEDDDEPQTYVPVTYYGYRKSVQGKTQDEINAEIEDLKRNGVEHIKLRKSVHSHLGIPAGTPFLQIFDEQSAIALEKMLLKKGIELPADRYKEYGLGYINRTPKEISPAVKVSIWDRLFGRK